MKKLIKITVSAMAMGVGRKAGVWLWDEVLESKANELKAYLTEKFSKNEEAS